MRPWQPKQPPRVAARTKQVAVKSMVRTKQVAVKSMGLSAPRKQLKHMAKKKKAEGDGHADGGGEAEGGKVERKVVSIKGRRRYKSGTVAVREIRRLSR